MDRNKTRDWIARWEGRRRHVYTDTKGHPTIGIGFNLDRPDAKEEIEALGLGYEDIRAGTQDLTDEQMDRLFDTTMDEAIAGARQTLSTFDDIPEDKQMVVVDMVFNLGAQKFSKFIKTIDAIENKQWDRAAQEMQNSSWFVQVGSGENQRGGSDVNIMRRPEPPRGLRVE
jgi:GH24 family phage-related lysozyme (muramidase)